ncbi:MAG TPA: GNAT family N-acetyltransferase [Ktedonobacterales bacterium]|nr:GNAT family N-acetyltransferase [Ktedonobacterales bacterium]
MTTSIWEGRLVRLRAVTASDWEAFHAWDQDSEMARRSWCIPLPRAPEGTRQWTASVASETPPGDEFRFAIETLAGVLVGSLTVNSCEPRNGTFSYGIAIGLEHRRHGFASEAVRLALRYYFQERRYQKVTAHVYAFNEPSIRLHERLGFQREGCLRRMIYTDGHYFEDLLFGMTAEEFAESQKESPI